MEKFLKTKLPEKICDFICKQIRSGVFPPGAKLPTVLQLAEQFQVSSFTAAAAVKLLKQKGWIETAPKRGSVVARKIPETPRQHQNTLRDTIYFLFEAEKISFQACSDLLSREAADYHYMFATYPVENEREIHSILQRAGRNAAGFLITHSFIQRRLLLPQTVPTVILNSGHHNFGYNEIIPDNYDTGWAVARYLHSRGHTRLGFISSFPPKYVLGGFHFRERLSGISDYCSYYRLPPPEVYFWDIRKKNGSSIVRNLMEELLRRSEKVPTAAAVGNLFMLEEIMDYARKEFNIPDFSQYMSLISFQDDFDDRKKSSADLAMIPLPVFARESIRLLLHLMNPEAAKHHYRTLISMEIVPGNTVHRLK